MTFKKAQRKAASLKMALTGTSGSGKTYSALLIARGLVGKQGKIAVIDTENGSASLYSSLTDYDTMEIAPPFSVEKYTLAINEAVKAGYDCLIIDSLTHAWTQLLLEKEQLDSRGGNSYTNWAKMTPKHQAFLDAILQSRINIIGTLRVKQEYVLELNDKGKQAPRKVGMAPIQRDGMEYEFTIVLDVSMDHSASPSKDRTGLFDGKIFKPSVETGEQIREWINSGEKKDEPKIDFELQETQINSILSMLKEKTDGMNPAEKGKFMVENCGVQSFKEFAKMSNGALSDIILKLEKLHTAQKVVEEPKKEEENKQEIKQAKNVTFKL